MLRTAGLLLATLAVTAACSFGPAWIFPTSAPLPEGAVPVPIRVSPIPNESSDVEFACPAALLLPVEMVVDRSVTPPRVAYRFVESGEPIEIQWSWGISAYDLDGVVHIVAPDGEDLMIEGVVADDIGGCSVDDDVFGACDVRSLPRRAGSSP